MKELDKYKNIFFIGVGGSGMSAAAQYLAGTDKNISGSDRIFTRPEGKEIKEKLEKTGIKCYPQDGSGITKDIDLVVVSTAIEETVADFAKAKKSGIKIMHRAELLEKITLTKKTIAVAGTSGKSTTTAMIFQILQFAGLKPSLITGAGLVSIEKQGLIGNAYVDTGRWLVIEADESDGTLVRYKPEIGLILNIDKDHKEINQLIEIFTTFRNNTRKHIILNANHKLSSSLKNEKAIFFGYKRQEADFNATDFSQNGFRINFKINNTPFVLDTIGKYNMENALAATAAANLCGVDIKTSAAALEKYEGIYRRNQIIAQKNGITIIDDYAHNPVKISSEIKACQAYAKRVIAWFQPHGFTPTRFMRKELTEAIIKTLRKQDIFVMPDIYYVGGTVKKDISSKDIIEDIRKHFENAYYIAKRNDFQDFLKKHIRKGDLILIMGARDPSLPLFARQVANQIIQ